MECNCTICDILGRIQPNARIIMANNIREYSSIFNERNRKAIEMLALQLSDPKSVKNPSDLSWPR